MYQEGEDRKEHNCEPYAERYLFLFRTIKIRNTNYLPVTG